MGKKKKIWNTKKKVNFFFLSLGYSGLFPKAPGTFGSFVALILGMLILIYFETHTLFFLAILISLISIKAINRYEEKTKIHDDKRIVIDELAGMWLALSIAPAISVNMQETINFENGFLIQSFISFLLFRYFDIKKPSIIGRVDREVKGGLGVMGDDIIAGISAGITSSIIWQGYLKIFS